MQILPICFIVDKNVQQHLGPVCKSILKHLTIPHHFCILTDVSDTIPLIKATVGDDCTVLALTDENRRYLSSFYVAEDRKDITSFVYAQLLLPRIFPQYQKILFMEPDQIVRSDLAILWKNVWKHDIKLGAVAYTCGENTLRTLAEEYPELSVRTYNAGVMVVDTHFWRENNFDALCFAACRKQKEMDGGYYDYYPEGAMNVALQQYFTELSPKYNTCNLGWCPYISTDMLESAVILHWNGTNKPWKSDGWYREYYAVV